MKSLFSIQKENIINYNIYHIKKILERLLYNLNSPCDNYAILIVGKLIRKIFKNKRLLPYVLNLNIIQILIYYSKSENFILTKECLKILLYLFKSTKVESNILSEYMKNNEQKISLIFFKDISNSNKYYYLIRFVLILLYIIYNNPVFKEFTYKNINNIYTLKSIMYLLNNDSEQIRINSIILLYIFFNNIDNIDINVKKLIYLNKNNFIEYFNDVPNTNVEILEKKKYILFVLDRLNK